MHFSESEQLFAALCVMSKCMQFLFQMYYPATTFDTLIPTYKYSKCIFIFFWNMPLNCISPQN